MAKVPADTIKYNIYAEIAIDGVVDKPDVVGAIFGQTEGLLGEELELRELQKTGRIGRIVVDIKANAGKSTGTILIPSSLDMVETSIIAAAIETVDRVGPCNAKITVTEIEDARSAKRKFVVERAKTLLKKLIEEEIPESEELSEEVRKAVQLEGITTYKGLPAGPGVESAESVILVEGRADVVNMLKAGVRNVIAIGGTNIPKQIVELSKEKTTIAFLDGDRGGDIILRELTQVANIDFVARAPKGKEVEELSKKEIILSLRRKIPLSQVRGYESKSVGGVKEKARTKENNKRLLNLLKDVKGKLIARLYDENLELITEIEIKDLIDSLKDVQPYCIVFDGVVTQRLIDAASESKVKYVVGVNKSAVSDTKNVTVLIEKG
ncbi:MAG: DNA primase [Candidatus Altiarchaeales archaeon]|nr:MAG: DNA primase [Candidatus Altiarchaeales archaeon]RLI93664.1 MAG: DNA primase [Candidatus Altiarchaeales archaeon]RLI94961.1 MAG: DNA primase [Candidatus Altiarchaeales archaeon]HDO82339.1 DNA primase [Candidatus Altiarchaeales archaeon]HEX54988.1 DNA primase [Candidatus Altiarchaeales archaeon]